MASFSIDRGRIKGRVTELRGIESTLNTLQGEISQVSRTLSLRGYNGDVVRSSLRRQAQEVLDYRGKVGSLKSGLEEIISAYSSTEDTLLGKQGEMPGLPKLIIPGFVKWKSYISKWVTGVLSNSDDPRVKSVAVLKGTIEGAGSLFGISTGGSLYGELLGASYDTSAKASAKYEWKDGKWVFNELAAEASITGEAHVAKGKVEGHLGYLSGSLEGIVGKVSATGTIGAALYKDGKLAPQLYAKIGGKAVAAEGSANAKFGSDDNNLHVKASGEVGSAEAKVEGSIGKITYEENGVKKTTYGAKVVAGAEAYAATGKVSGGFSIFGIKVDIGLSGKAGGAGGKIGGYVGTGGVKGSISAGLGLGAGLDISIDWSDFSLKKLFK